MKIVELEAKIQSEQSSINKAEASKAELVRQRSEALASGDDASVDRIEREIESAEKTISRGRERIDLLNGRIAETKAAEHEADLDALAARAERAHQLGVTLILNDYRKASAAVADVMKKLTAIDEFIVAANRRLAANNRDLVIPPNSVRCRKSERVESVKRMRLGINDPQHPYYGRATTLQHDTHKAKVTATNEVIDAFGEYDVKVSEYIPPIVRMELQHTVNLPEVTHADPAQWHGDLSLPAQVIEETIKALGLDNEPATGLIGKLKAIGGRAA